MKIALFACLLFCAGAVAQSPEAMKFAPRPILLVSPDNNEGVMPMVFAIDGQQHLEFVPTSQIDDTIKRGGLPVRLGDVLSALTEATAAISKLQEQNNQLQTENDKLWKLAMKDAPRPATVIVQQPAQPVMQDNRLERYMLLRSLLVPQRQTLNLSVTDCTRSPALCVGR